MVIDDFIFQPGTWLGEGKITLSNSREAIKFYTKWEISQRNSGVMQALQRVEMQGVEEQVLNVFQFSDLSSSHFVVTVKNQIIDPTQGKGLRDQRIIAWEFPLESPMYGFEVYEIQENGDFSFHAEYGGKGDFTTAIEGLIWKKA